MKRLTALVAILAIAALTAYAGPYFVVENLGLTLAPSLVVGWDFEAPFVDFTNLSISGDFYIMNDNLAAYPTPWIGGYDLGFAFCNEVARDVFELGLGMDVELLPAPWPYYVELTSWVTSIDIIGYPSDAVTIYGIINLVYDAIAGPIGVWDFEPVIGLEVRWP